MCIGLVFFLIFRQNTAFVHVFFDSQNIGMKSILFYHLKKTPPNAHDILNFHLNRIPNVRQLKITAFFFVVIEIR